MKFMLPKEIASFEAGTTIPPVDETVGEVAWDGESHAYAVNNEAAYDGKIYSCVKDHTSSPSKTPDKDAEHWLYKQPTNRMAPFDNYLFTRAHRPGSFTYEFPASFIDGLYLGGVVADHVDIEITDTDGDVIPPISEELWDQAYGLWEYLFGDLGKADYYSLSDIPMRPDLNIKVTLTRNVAENEAELGYMRVGNWKKVVSQVDPNISAAQFGASSQTKDYSQTIDYADGTYRYIEGRQAKNINVSCVMASDQAPIVDKWLTLVSGKAVPVEVSQLAKYSHLSTVGKISGTVSTTNWISAKAEFQIKGNI